MTARATFATQTFARRSTPPFGVTFAFGSNTDRAQMRRRCPRAIELGLVHVAGYRLEFFGAADVERDPAAGITAVAWRLDAADESALDAHEGVCREPVPSYVKVPVAAHRLAPAGCGAAVLRGFLYAMTPLRRARDPRPPAPDYLARVVAGYAQHGIDPAGLWAAHARALRAAAP